MKKIERQEKMIDEIKMIIGAIVIPNETILNVPIFRQSKAATRKKGYHYELFKEFCDKYTIPYEGIFTELAIVKSGHVTINTIDKWYAVVMIPEYISEKQYEEIKNERIFLETFNNFEARISETTIAEIPPGYEGTIIDYFYEELEEYYRKKGNENGRR